MLGFGTWIEVSKKIHSNPCITTRNVGYMYNGNEVMWSMKKHAYFLSLSQQPFQSASHIEEGDQEITSWMDQVHPIVDIC